MSKGKNKTKNGNDGLKSKVFDTKFETDERGRFFYFCNALENLSITQNNRIYIPFCGFRIHNGLIDDLQVCYSRHYPQLRKLKPIRFRQNPQCHSLYKIYTKRNSNSFSNSRANA